MGVTLSVVGDASDDGAKLNGNKLGAVDDCIVVGDGEEEGGALIRTMLGVTTSARDGAKLVGIGVVGAAAFGATENDPVFGAPDDSVSVVGVTLVDITDGEGVFVGKGSVVELDDDGEEEGPTLISAALADVRD